MVDTHLHMQLFWRKSRDSRFVIPRNIVKSKKRIWFLSEAETSSKHIALRFLLLLRHLGKHEQWDFCFYFLVNESKSIYITRGGYL